ncbi:unnamed protein product [Amoebophrya sp. A25]|nr:unnamed protein product [Amoebophrya sp. A25]|eukprot:GSA25T00015590001.1
MASFARNAGSSRNLIRVWLSRHGVYLAAMLAVANGVTTSRKKGRSAAASKPRQDVGSAAEAPTDVVLCGDANESASCSPSTDQWSSPTTDEVDNYDENTIATGRQKVTTSSAGVLPMQSVDERPRSQLRPPPGLEGVVARSPYPLSEDVAYRVNALDLHSPRGPSLLTGDFDVDEATAWLRQTSVGGSTAASISPYERQAMNGDLDRLRTEKNIQMFEEGTGAFLAARKKVLKKRT